MDGYEKNYADTLEIADTVSFSPDSYFMDTQNKKVQVKAQNWVWRRLDSNPIFEFDSEAERLWAELLFKHASGVAGSITNTDGETIYLLGKNFYPNSEIKYEYYLNGIHSSYPDFILQDKHGRVHIFEVKSLSHKTNSAIDESEYTEKIASLIDCYSEASNKTGHWFYIPVFENGHWYIHRFKPGSTYNDIKSLF